ncbi:MAG TPA: hypothetical protein VHT73_18715 [Thermodesulfobacteriota bacterium]|nr:hypothetical protein [Thermodesulfobacteriota bacterium]
MKKIRQRVNTKISRAQMVDAITRSGYLLEQRVFPIIEDAGFYVETNPVFPDPATGKSREYDFSALSGIKVYREWNFLWVHLIGECVNNPQPIVFFSSEKTTNFMFHEDLKCSGIPLWFPARDSRDGEISFQEFLHLEKFHHYCKGSFSTQYCSFRQKSGKTEWLAWHDDEHHGLFDSLVAATEYEISEFFSSWDLPKKTEEEPLNINLFYPILIVKSDLYQCEQKKSKPLFTNIEHIQFRKSVISGKKARTFHIDVITEAYLSDYLQLLEDEHEKIRAILKRRKSDVRSAIEQIVTQARNAKAKNKRADFREILEF